MCDLRKHKTREVREVATIASRRLSPRMDQQKRRFGTGVYGASVGTAVLDSVGIGSDNLVPRGIAMGASAHSIGTAALMEREPEVKAASCVRMHGLCHHVTKSLF